MMQEKRKITEVAAGVLIRDDGAVLMGSRPEGKPYAGWWEFPGGKFEPGETAAEALARELREELDIEAGESFPWLTKVISYPHALVRLHFRRCWQWSGELCSMEHQQFGFYRRGQLPAGELLPMDDIIAGWIDLPAVAAYLPHREGADLAERVRAAVSAGAGLIWSEDTLSETPSGLWTGNAKTGFASKAGTAVWNGICGNSLPETGCTSEPDFMLAETKNPALLCGNTFPVYWPAESASELQDAVREGAHGVWLRF